MQAQFSRHLARNSLLAALSLGGMVAGYGQTLPATTTLGVTATVPASCTISATPVAFGSYDPIVANATGVLDATGTVTTTCTLGSMVHITLDEGANKDGLSTPATPGRNMVDSSTDTLSYSLYQNSTHDVLWGGTVDTSLADTGTGTASQKIIYGRMSGGQNKPAGSYSDTVNVSVGL